MLDPGQPACMYHAENAQENYFVLAGECLLLVEGEERRLKQLPRRRAAVARAMSFSQHRGPMEDHSNER